MLVFKKDHSANVGRKVSEETKRKQGGQKGRVPWNKGKKGVFKHSEESKKKISKHWNKLGTRHSEERKKKMSKRMTGEKNPMYGKTGSKHNRYGKHHSEETRRKISTSTKASPNSFKKGGLAWNKGTKGLVMANTGSFKKGNMPWNKDKPMSKELRRKLSEIKKKKYDDGYIAPMKGRKHSKKARQKMSEKITKAFAREGYVTWNKGKPISKEARMKMIRTMGTPEYRASLSKRRSTYTVPKKIQNLRKFYRVFVILKE